jgi:putative tryptophan/tyrosine transport system substrate-binding protein
MLVRKAVWSALALLCALLPVSSSLAQQQAKVWRIAYFHRGVPTADKVYRDAFIEGMRELGYVDAKDYVLDWRYAEGQDDRLPRLVGELIEARTDIVIAIGNVAIAAVLARTTAIPIVAPVTINPVAAGFAKSLAQPGGSITGLTPPAEQLPIKQLELLRTAIPRMSRVGVLVSPANTFHGMALKLLQTSADSVNVRVVAESVRTSEELGPAFARLARERAHALIVMADPVFLDNRQRIADLAIKSRLPSIYALREHAQAGGMLSYAADIVGQHRRAAAYVDKIFKGAKPGDLPIEQASNLSLVVNRRTAKALGVPIPQSLLLQANETIE